LLKEYQQSAAHDKAREEVNGGVCYRLAMECAPDLSSALKNGYVWDDAEGMSATGIQSV
jgi:hypothetical protein